MVRSVAVTISMVALLSGLPCAAAVDVHASLSRDSIAVGETVQLTVAVSGAVTGVRDPELPPVDYLQVVSSSSQQSVEIVNTRVNSMRSYVFGIQASREGTYTIPPIEVHVGSQVYSTRPLTLRVVGASSQPIRPGSGGGAPPSSETPMPPAGPSDQPAPRDVDATLEIDNQTPWVGQQVTMTFSFYQARDVALMGSAEYSPPATKGLVAEPLPDAPPSVETIGGVAFTVIQRRTALIAPAPGAYTVGPASVTFRRGYLGSDETISTKPVVLKVRPLPTAGRPQGFGGFVGSLHAELQAPSARVKVGEAVTLHLIARGTGDLRQLEAPELSVTSGARVYKSGEQRDVAPRLEGQDYVIGGTASFDYLVMPDEAGEVTIQPVTLSYFNPASDRYETAQTSAVKLMVLPGEGGATALRPEAGELHPLRVGNTGLRARPPVTSAIWFWLLQLLPLGGLVWAARRRGELLRRVADPAYRRCVEAAANARHALSAIDAAAEAREIYDGVDGVLTEYVAAKARTAAASLSPEAAASALVSAGVGEETAENAGRLIALLRAGVYAPGASALPAAGEVVAQAQALIGDIEGELG